MFMTEAVYLTVDNYMALENSMVEYEVCLEVVIVNQDTFLPGFEAKASAHFQKELLQMVYQGFFECGL